jgi:hypothetical protein
MAMELEAARRDLGLHAAQRKGRATELLQAFFLVS